MKKTIRELFNIDFKKICALLDINRNKQAYARLYKKEYLLPRLKLEEKIIVDKRNEIIREIYLRTGKNSYYRRRLEIWSRSNY